MHSFFIPSIVNYPISTSQSNISISRSDRASLEKGIGILIWTSTERTWWLERKTSFAK